MAAEAEEEEEDEEEKKIKVGSYYSNYGVIRRRPHRAYRDIRVHSVKLIRA